MKVGPTIGRIAVLATLVLAVAACGSEPEPDATTEPPATDRPSSTAELAFVNPLPGATVEGESLTVELSLEGATILKEATQDLAPDEGHIHLRLDGELVSMTYGLEQSVGVEPGNHLIEAEFVAGDHSPFDPRVVVNTTFTSS